jgi:hypothetical protein
MFVVAGISALVFLGLFFAVVLGGVGTRFGVSNEDVECDLDIGGSLVVVVALSALDVLLLFICIVLEMYSFVFTRTKPFTN